MPLKATWLAMLALATTAGAFGNAGAQTFPSRPLTIVVPFPAGGPADTLARILAEPMRVSLGQTVIIENVSGAGGTIGIGRVARAAPDGHTISIGHLNSHVFSGAVYSTSYDLLTDFEPVSLIANSPMVLIARSNLPPQTLNDLVAWLKTNPDKASFGTIGSGSPSRAWGISFQSSTGTRFQFVPYRGAAPLMQDLLGGQIDLASPDVSNLVPYLSSGKIKAYAVLAKTRSSVAPAVPTIDETGVPGFHMTFWHGFWVPKGTPADAIARLNAAAVQALADPSVRKRFAELGQEVPAREQQTPQALATHHKAEIARWWPIIKAAGIRAQ